ncbi:hypothetical protein BHE74_00025350 [Ensete ventricosum]|nr:hypothetical protein BHE74_00025350 [Ensete ventricosum]
MARPHTGATSCVQGLYMGGRTRPGSLARAAAHGQALYRGGQATRGNRPCLELLLAGAVAWSNDCLRPRVPTGAITCG